MVGLGTGNANLQVFAQIFSSELFHNKNSVFLPWLMGNDLNSEKAHEPIKTKQIRGEKTRIGKVMVMVDADWQKGLREHWLHKIVAVDAWRKTVGGGREKKLAAQKEQNAG